MDCHIDVRIILLGTTISTLSSELRAQLGSDYAVPTDAEVFLGAPFVPYWRLYMAQWDITRRALVVTPESSRLFVLDSSAVRVERQIAEAGPGEITFAVRLSGSTVATLPGGERIVVRGRQEAERLRHALE